MAQAALARRKTIDILSNAAATKLCHPHDCPVHLLAEKVRDKTLAVSLKYGIRVNIISPSYIMSEGQTGWYTTNLLAAAATDATHVLGRCGGKPEELAEMAFFCVPTVPASRPARLST